MKTIILSIAAALSLLGLSGCATQPAATTTTSFTYALGDRSTYKMDEIVVSLPLHGLPTTYQNLHISLGVLINPIRESASDDSDAQSLVRRLEPRINATVSAALQDLGPQSLATTKALRSQAIAEADKVISKAIRNWKYAADYNIEVAVMSLYWTDASAGLTTTPTSRW
jgi:hypothetical protein